MDNKTIIIFIVLGLVFGMILSTVHHFTSETKESEQFSTNISDYNCSIDGEYYHYSFCEEPVGGIEK